MKKLLSKVLVISVIFSFLPTNFSLAITQNQINSEVQIVCTDGADNWFSGSGTIIDPKGIILTNRHVVEGTYKNTCFIGFLESINKEPNFGTKENPNLAEVKYITTTNDMDAAVLYLNNPTNSTYPFVNIWNSNSANLKFGDKIEVIGYPSIGGSTVTYTSGDFSGYGGQSDNTGNYIKTTAVLEHGNSGGSAYNQRGEFIGIPSMVVSGSLNSISFILSVDSIKKWLTSVLGNEYKQQIIENKPFERESSGMSLQTDITPPNFNVLNELCYVVPFKYSNLDTVAIGARCFPPKLGKTEQFNHLQFTLGTGQLNDIDKNGLKNIYYYFDKKPRNNVDSEAIQYAPKNISNGKLSITNWIDIKYPGKYYFTFFGEDNFGNISNAYIYEYVYSPVMDDAFLDRIKGKILLDVENHGEAWYVDVKTKLRYYMANGNEAYKILRNLGVGIKNSDLYKIKVDKKFAKKFSGKILLQVENHGEAYYIDFNGNAVYLKDGSAAYSLMRKLGAGITSNDLGKIFAGSF